MRNNLLAYLRALAVAAGAIAILTDAGTAHAQVIVLQSTVAKYKPGSSLAKSSQLSIPEGGLITVVLASGKTKSIPGPYEGKVADLSKGGGQSNAALFGAVKQFLKTGGATTKTVGAVRGVAPGEKSSEGGGQSSSRFSWTNVALGYSRGDLCLDKNGAISITRTNSAADLTVSVVDLGSTLRANIRFAAGQAEVPWPAEIALKNGTYALLVPGSRMQQIRVRLIDQLPTAEQTLQVLHGQRCSLQFDDYLRGFMVAGQNQN